MKTRWWLLAILLLALIVRIYPLHPHAGWDESVYIQDAQVILGEKDNYTELEHRPPLFPLLLAGAFLIWNHVYAAQFLVNILSSLIVITLFLLGREVHSEKAGLLAALMAAIHPIFVETGHYILNDALLTVSLAFALYLTFKEGWKPAFLSGILAGLAILFKFTAAAPVSMLGLYWLYKEWPRLKKTIIYGLGVITPLIPYSIWLKIEYGSFIHSVVEALQGGGGALSDPWLIQFFNIPILIGLAAYLWKKKWDEHVTLSVAWLITLALPLSFLHIETRFLLPALVPIMYVAGAGLSEITDKEWKTGLAVLLIIVSSPWVYAKFATPAVHDHLPPSARTAQYINSQDRAGPIYATTNYPIYGRYTDRDIVMINPDSLQDYYPQLMQESGYVVIYEDQGLEEWADENPRFKRLKKDENVILYWYTSAR